MYGEISLVGNLNTAKGQDFAIWHGESKDIVFSVDVDLQVFDITWRVGYAGAIIFTKTATIAADSFTVSIEGADYASLDPDVIYTHEARLIAAGEMSILSEGYMKVNALSYNLLIILTFLQRQASALHEYI